MHFLRQIFDYLFPTERSYRRITDKKWVRVGSRISPIATTVMIIGILLLSLLFLATVQKKVGVFSLVLFFVTLGITGILGFLARIIRKKQRDPALIRLAMMVFPLRGIFIVLSALVVSNYMEAAKKGNDTISQTVSQKIEERSAFLKEQQERLEKQHLERCETMGNFLKSERERMTNNFQEAKKEFFKMMAEHEENRTKRMQAFREKMAKDREERAKQMQKDKEEMFIAFEKRIGFGPYLDAKKEREKRDQEMPH